MRLAPASCVALIALSATAAHGGNLLTNGSFEQGLTGWSSAGPVSVRSDQQPSDGASSLVFDYGVGVFGGEVTQALTLTPGVTYALQLDHWALGAPTQRRLLVNVTLFENRYNTYVTIFNSEVFFTSSVPTTYETFTGSFTVPLLPFFSPETPTVVWLKDLTSASNGLTSDLNIDRVSLTAVPEPTKLAQLAVGICALLVTRAITRARSSRARSR